MHEQSGKLTTYRTRAPAGLRRGMPVYQQPRPALGGLVESGEIDLRAFVTMILRRKFMLVGIVAAGIAAAQWWIISTVPRYSADALIMIEGRPSTFVSVDSARQELGNEAVTVNTQMAVLRSRTLAAKVIDEMDLDQDPDFVPGLVQREPGPLEVALNAVRGLVDRFRGSPPDPMVAQRLEIEALQADAVDLAAVGLDPLLEEATPPGLSAGQEGPAAPATNAPLPPALLEVQGQRERSELINNFISRLSVRSEDQSRLIYISFESSDPVQAAAIANALLAAYVENQLAAKTEGVRRTAEWLEARLAELGETVNTLEQTVLDRRAEVGLLQSDGQNIAPQRLSQINAELVRTGAELAVAEARYRQIQSLLRTGNDIETLPEVIGSPAVQSHRARLVQLRGTLSELLARYQPEHRRVVAVQAEIDELESQIAAEMQTVLSGVRNQVAYLRQQEQALQGQLNNAGEEVSRLGAAELTIGQLSTQLRANRDLYESLLKRYTETVALRDNQQPDARVISEAQIPLAPSYPKKGRTLVLATVASLAMALLTIFLAERFRNRFDRGEDVERQLGMRVIGVPDLPRLWRVSAPDPRDYIEREPLSDFGSSFQRLRAMLALANSRRMPGVILVTSPESGDGKTTVSVCLGIASVSSGQSVIIVDCDFVSPSIHRTMGVPNEVGLSEVLAGSVPLEQAIVTLSPVMAVLPVGKLCRGGIDLLNSENMQDLLEELRKRYALVILDSSPVDRMSDPLILGSLAEKSLLVVRRDYTSQTAAAKAAEQLQLYGADLAAVIFNRAEGGSRVRER